MFLPTASSRDTCRSSYNGAGGMSVHYLEAFRPYGTDCDHNLAHKTRSDAIVSQRTLSRFQFSVVVCQAFVQTSQ